MEIEVVNKFLGEIRCDALVLAIFEDHMKPVGVLEQLDNILEGLISHLVRDGDIRGRFAEYTILHSERIPATRIVIMGLGKRKDFHIDRVRSIAALAARIMRKVNARHFVISGYGYLGIPPEEWACAAVEGAIMGLYRFNKYKTDPEETRIIPAKMTMVARAEEDMPVLEEAVRLGKILADATNFARDIVNEPSNEVTPSTFAKIAQAVAMHNGLEYEVLNEGDLEKLGMGAFLAVARGTKEPAKMIILRYRGKNGGWSLALLGKGVTFDSGGLDIKKSEDMARMYADCAGAAAVLAAMEAIAKLRLPINVIALLPTTENLPSGYSYKPGDIVRSLSGKTIEILSTDAEGRLVLADALTYAHNVGADRIVDIATLTGGCVVALGHVTSGIMGNDQALVDTCVRAGAMSSEKIWQLPLFEEYREQIVSDVADLENSGGRPASAVTAGMFLREFVGDASWAHIDIAGTAVIEKGNQLPKIRLYLPKEGATGTGVRTLINLARILAREDDSRGR